MLKLTGKLKRFAHAWWISLVFCACQAGLSESPGEMARLVRVVSDFDTLEVNDDIHVNLYQSDSYQLLIKAPEELISGIETQVQNRRLTLSNQNNSLWLKNFPQFTVHIYTPDLKYLHYKGYGKVQAMDTLHIRQLTVNAKNAYGSIRLLLECEKLNIVSNSPTMIHLEGRTKHLISGNYFNDGRLYASSLKAQNVVVHHRGESLVEVNALESLKGEVWNVGDLIYYGHPEQVDVKLSGQGRLIQK